MDLLDFFIIAVVSSLALFVWQLLTWVYPAYRAAKIQESLAALTKANISPDVQNLIDNDYSMDSNKDV